MTNYQTLTFEPTKKVTIVMPVYNVADYIYASLTSALDQDMDDMEIVVVDDCGTDSSMEIVRQLQATHPKGQCLRIIRHDVNKGLGEARNTAMREAQGKYIFLLDSDDFITPNAISTLYKAAEAECSELTYGSTVVKEMDGREHPFFVLPRLTLSGKNALVNYIYSTLRQNVPFYVWNILYLTSFLRSNGFLFPPIRKSEDIMFNELIQPKVTKAVLLPDITYCYVMRPNSLMSFQARETIGVEEALNALKYSESLKNMCKQHRAESYYDGKCAKTMKGVFYRICGILKHRQQLTGKVSDRQLRDVMCHPASLSEILRFKQHKGANLLFWFLGKLPSKLFIVAIKTIGRKKGLL